MYFDKYSSLMPRNGDHTKWSFEFIGNRTVSTSNQLQTQMENLTWSLSYKTFFLLIEDDNICQSPTVAI